MGRYHGEWMAVLLGVLLFSASVVATSDDSGEIASLATVGVLNKAGDARDEYVDWKSSSLETVEETTGGAHDTPNEWVEWVKDKVSERLEQVKEGTDVHGSVRSSSSQEASDIIPESTTEVLDTADDSKSTAGAAVVYGVGIVSQASETVKQTYDAAGEKVKGVAYSASETAKDAYMIVKESAGSVINRGQEKAKGISNAAKERVQKAVYVTERLRILTSVGPADDSKSNDAAVGEHDEGMVSRAATVAKQTFDAAGEMVKGSSDFACEMAKDAYYIAKETVGYLGIIAHEKTEELCNAAQQRAKQVINESKRFGSLPSADAADDLQLAGGAAEDHGPGMMSQTAETAKQMYNAADQKVKGSANSVRETANDAMDAIAEGLGSQTSDDATHSTNAAGTLSAAKDRLVEVGSSVKDGMRASDGVLKGSYETILENAKQTAGAVEEKIGLMSDQAIRCASKAGTEEGPLGTTVGKVKQTAGSTQEKFNQASDVSREFSSKVGERVLDTKDWLVGSTSKPSEEDTKGIYDSFVESCKQTGGNAQEKFNQASDGASQYAVKAGEILSTTKERVVGPNSEASDDGGNNFTSGIQGTYHTIAEKVKQTAGDAEDRLIQAGKTIEEHAYTVAQDNVDASMRAYDITTQSTKPLLQKGLQKAEQVKGASEEYVSKAGIVLSATQDGAKHTYDSSIESCKDYGKRGYDTAKNSYCATIGALKQTDDNLLEGISSMKSLAADKCEKCYDTTKEIYNSILNDGAHHTDELDKVPNTPKFAADKVGQAFDIGRDGLQTCKENAAEKLEETADFGRQTYMTAVEKAMQITGKAGKASGSVQDEIEVDSRKKYEPEVERARREYENAQNEVSRRYETLQMAKDHDVEEVRRNYENAKEKLSKATGNLGSVLRQVS